MNRKKVNVTFSITMEQDVPEDWDKAMIEFHFNDSCWCADNFLVELNQYSDEHGCICNICKATVEED